MLGHSVSNGHTRCVQPCHPDDAGVSGGADRKTDTRLSSGVTRLGSMDGD